MALHLKDCSPALRAKIEAALGSQYRPEPWYAMATFLKGRWTIGPMTTSKTHILKLVSRFNVSTGPHARLTSVDKPPAVLVEIDQLENLK